MIEFQESQKLKPGVKAATGNNVMNGPCSRGFRFKEITKTLSPVPVVLGVLAVVQSAVAGDYVMTQEDCEGKRAAPDPIALGSFGMDSHVVQHFVTESGRANSEGVIWRVPPKPYGISYRSIIPRKGECENLLSPICVSASHVGHGSIRMEPVFVALAQSAAVAAGVALDNGVSVQEVSYPVLRERLVAEKQRF